MEICSTNKTNHNQDTEKKIGHDCSGKLAKLIDFKHVYKLAWTFPICQNYAPIIDELKNMSCSEYSFA